MIGCGLGNMYYHLHELMFGDFDSTNPRYISPATFSILGATAVLSGATRMTFALAVIMLETTSSVELFLPIIFTLFISYGTGTLLINKSTYLSALRSKNIPLLGKSAPRCNRKLPAYKIMSKPVRSFHFVVKV
jgi:H+/Cl- antiporter ClcA